MGKRNRTASSLGSRYGGGRESRNSHRQPLLRLHRRRRLQLRRGTPINSLGAQPKRRCSFRSPAGRIWWSNHSLNPGVSAQPFFRQCASILFACSREELPFLPPLHSSEHRNRIGDFNITSQPKVFAENLCRSCLAQWIRRRIGFGSVKKDAYKLPTRSQQLRDTFGILRPSPRLKRAQKSSFIDQIKV